MNLIFETQCTAAVFYDPSNFAVTVREDRRWQAVGESYAGPPFLKRLLQIAAIIGMIVSGILLLCIPFIFSSYSQTIADLTHPEKIINVHFMPYADLKKEDPAKVVIETKEHDLGMSFVCLKAPVSLPERVVVETKADDLGMSFVTIEPVPFQEKVVIKTKEGDLDISFINLQDPSEKPAPSGLGRLYTYLYS